MTRILLALLLGTLAIAADARPTVEVASLTYGGGKSSKCFSNAFLSLVASETGIATNPQFVTIAAGDAKAMARTPFALLTGEGAYTLPEVERATLKAWMQRGGFLVASASCSSKEWSASFRREMESMFGAGALEAIKPDHPIFHTVFDVNEAPLKHTPLDQAGSATFEGIVLDGRLVCLFSHEGLNDTGKVDGCCCCGGNEIKNSRQVVANALVYALVE